MKNASFHIHFCGSEICESGHSFGPAVRPHYLLHVILEGKGMFYKRGQACAVEKGGAFLIRPGELTSYQADAGNPWEYAWAAFDGTETDALLEQTGFRGGAAVCRSADSALLGARMRELAREAPAGGYNAMETTARLLLVLSCLYEESEADGSNQHLQKACEYIRRNYAYALQVADVAAFVGIDRTYLYKLFLRFEQCSPKQYLTRYRLRAAEEMLLNGRYNITETAFSCGFQDVSSFCRQFKAKTGLSPAAYRRKADQL